MSNKLEICTDFIHIFDHPVSREEAILTLVSLLRAKNYVLESYAQAIIEREKIFPTGLPTEPYGIAIPHTDPEHVNRGAIAVGILVEPVLFTEMGSDDSQVPVEIIAMLAIKDAKNLVIVLRQLASSFQNKEFLAGLKNATDQQTVLDLFTRTVPDVVKLV